MRRESRMPGLSLKDSLDYRVILAVFITPKWLSVKRRLNKAITWHLYHFHFTIILVKIT